jgi:hypothetical protein
MEKTNRIVTAICGGLWDMPETVGCEIVSVLIVVLFRPLL